MYLPGLSRLIDEVLTSRMGWMEVTFAKRVNPGKRTRCMDYMIGLTLNLHTSLHALRKYVRWFGHRDEHEGLYQQKCNSTLSHKSTLHFKSHLTGLGFFCFNLCVSS